MPPLTGYLRNRPAEGRSGAREPEPTAHLPGTPAKVAEMRRRAMRGEALFSPRDVLDDPRRHLLVPYARNGKSVVRGEIQTGTPLRPEYTGDRVRARRLALGMARSELARAAGISHIYLWMLETARRRYPSARVLFSIAAALGVPARSLLP